MLIDRECIIHISWSKYQKSTRTNKPSDPNLVIFHHRSNFLGSPPRARYAYFTVKILSR